MNRTLKLRIWCDNQKQFSFIDLYKDNFNINQYANPKIHQFTGLTDSNGNNIYEEDILKIENAFQSWVVKYEIDQFILESLSKNFVFKKIGLSEFLNANIFDSKVIVIGNLLTNPELENEFNDQNTNSIPNFLKIDDLLNNLTTKI